MQHSSQSLPQLSKSRWQQLVDLDPPSGPPKEIAEDGDWIDAEMPKKSFITFKGQNHNKLKCKWQIDTDEYDRLGAAKQDQLEDLMEDIVNLSHSLGLVGLTYRVSTSDAEEDYMSVEFDLFKYGVVGFNLSLYHLDRVISWEDKIHEVLHVVLADYTRLAELFASKKAEEELGEREESLVTRLAGFLGEFWSVRKVGIWD